MRRALCRPPWRRRDANVLGPGSLRGPNGITLSADGTHAYVAEYVYGIARVDLAAGSFVPVAVPATIAMIGVDGLYLRGNELVAVQNYAGLDRAAAFRLDESGVPGDRGARSRSEAPTDEGPHHGRHRRR